jgi:Mg-chelatase subunit ChlD
MDVSGSMGRDDGSGTRLALAQSAINSMIDSYSAIGTVNVNLTSFQATATSYGWQSAADAKADISALSAGGYTNYEDAMYKTYTGYTDPNSSAKTIVLFISDGEPTKENLEGRDVSGNIGLDAENGWIDSAYLTAWKSFIDSNADELKVLHI